MPAPSLPAPPDLDGWVHRFSGKVRDVYAPATPHPAGDVLLLVASDRVSAYDHVLSTPVPGKGAVLTALSRWWFEQLADLVDHHVVDAPVPAAVAGRAVVVRALDMVPVECVARGWLSGSGTAEYRASGAVCGVPLPAGLTEGSRLPEPVFTPATKAALGDHDENVTFEHVVGTVGRDTAEELRRITLAVYARAVEVAARAGIIVADTKLELGRVPGGDGRLVLGDEVLTPDSSRYWPADAWSPGRPQPSLDKQVVRDWLTSPASGWDRDSGEAPPPLPDDVVDRTAAGYREVYRRLTGADL
ncbi:phosphoribosylaminoimidazolesuccinocarboxamide synthase [Aquipuribacter nitratireducens]|uniref:Phosphoribosylaminoimidazole-succinocarboxamide synthase n=1 Tax=Aquipuribacter nitratireducens TaxID=650104 RepID=A0ABW0GP59_9MICO